VAARRSRIAPSAATPIATPLRRKALLIPEAIPVREGSTTRNAAAAIAGFARPIPMPATMKPGRSAVQRELDVSPYMSASESATSTRPTVSSRRSGARGASFRVASGTAKTKTVSGRKSSPAPSGE